MKSKKTRYLVIFIGAVAFLGAASFIALQIFFRLSHPSYSGTEKLDGLTARVEVRTDDHGVPHITAANEADLFFAQGYITARERMFQMDLTRLAGRGELSSILGETTIKTDKYFKTMGFYRAARAEYARLDPRTRALVDAYTRGINAYIGAARHLPREYFLLGAKPEPWLPADSIVGGILMAYRLNAPREIKPLLYRIHLKAGSELFKLLMPGLPEGAPFVSVHGAGAGAPEPARCDVPYSPRSVTEPSSREALNMPYPMKVRASNWIAISGSRTASGKPIFAGSPDLEAAIPSLFYLVHLKGGEYNVIGGSIPGIPGVHALGFNGKFAWSTTVGNGDNLDFFVETPNPSNPDQYLTENGYKDYVIVEETLRIKMKDTIRQEKYAVKISRHGPIISDVVPDMPKNCAMMWAGLQEPVNMAAAYLALDKAQNFNEFRAALGMSKGGSVNIGYADTDGNIGYQFITTFPIRKSGDNPLPRPGDAGRYDWAGFVPFEDHPHDLNPAKGYLASFNQMPKPGNYYGTAYFLFERPFRFEDIMKGSAKFTLEDVRKMQLDTVSHLAQRWVPEILRVCAGVKGLEEYRSLMKNWDCSISLASPQAALFNSFFTRLMDNTLSNKIGKKLLTELCRDLHSTIPTQWLIRYMKDNDHIIWDDVSTPVKKETRDDMILKSMKGAVAELSGRYGGNTKNWAWGKVHHMPIKHPLGSVLPFLNLGPVPHPGDDFTINAGWYDREHPFTMISGGAIRIVMDMSDPGGMTLVCPPGQSGHFLSPYYSDQVDGWAEGRQIPANYTTAGTLKQVLVLEPGVRP